MPLSKPAPRAHMHTREIVCHGYQRDDGLWDIEGALVDTKTYSFDNVERGGIRAGEPIHAMRIRLTIDNEMVVHEAEAATEAAPFNICGNVAGAFVQLKGLCIGPGWRRTVRERFGKIRGCTHLTDMLLGPLATTAHQTVTAARARRHAAPDNGGKPALLDTCHALASDSPVVKRQWPEYYTGK